jgi:hypothetical protein
LHGRIFMTCDLRSGKSETKRKIAAAVAALRGAFICGMPLAITTLLGIPDALAQGRTLQIINQCAAQVWAVVTPGGNPTQGAALYNSAGWFQSSASQFNWVPTGFTGKTGANNQTLTVPSCSTCCPSGVSPCPNSSNFVAGQLIQVPIPGGTFVTTITAVSISSSSATLTVSPALPQKAVNAAPISIPAKMAASILAGQTLPLSIPNGGAPSVNFYFAMGNCPNGPFGGSCIIGSNALAQLNTLFEASFGCPTGQQSCAFNPSAPASSFPNCSTQPTLANCGPLASGDTYDVSAVNGYTIPMKVTVIPPTGAAAGQCGPIDGSTLDLASCPSETSATISSTDQQQQTAINGGVSLLVQNSGNYQACAAPFEWFTNGYGTPTNPHPLGACCGSSCNPAVPAGAYCTSTSYYAGAGCTNATDATSQALGCPAGAGGSLGAGSPAGAQEQVGPGSLASPTPNGRYAIHNTNYVQGLYRMGYRGYTWQYGDAVGTQTCPSIGSSGTSYPAYTVTLCPNGGIPYSATQGWTYSSSSGLCVLSTSGGSYASLAACQQANLKYACVAQPDDSGVPNAMWTVAATGISYSAIPTPTLTCQNVSLTFSKGGATTVPHCTYVYPGGSIANPCPQSRAHDFNGDGISDTLLETTSNGVGMWLLNSSAAIASAPGVGTLPSGWSIVGQRDFNGDGFADLLLRYTDGSVGEWLMSGATIKATNSLGNPGTAWSVVGTGDFSGDSIGDILWSGPGNSVAIWYMNSSGTLASAVGVGSLPAGWVVAGTGDFNGDGVWDILWYYQPSGAIAVWLMNSNGTIKSPVGLGTLPPATWSIAGTGDFNGDGISDILWLAGGTSVVIWFMNSSGGIASAMNVANLPSGWTIAQTGDLNGDGKADILLYFASSQAVGAWLMNGATVTSTVGIGSLPASWMLVTANSE